MNGYDLLKSFCYVDETLINESEFCVLRKKATPVFRRWLPIAACLCLMIAGAWAAIFEGVFDPWAASNDDTSDAEVAYDTLYTPTEAVSQPILRITVKALSDDGFIGTVISSDDAAYPVGMELEFRLEAPPSEGALSRDYGLNVDSGTQLDVELISYDSETNIARVRFLGEDSEKG